MLFMPAISSIMISFSCSLKSDFTSCKMCWYAPSSSFWALDFNYLKSDYVIGSSSFASVNPVAIEFPIYLLTIWDIELLFYLYNKNLKTNNSNI